MNEFERHECDLFHRLFYWALHINEETLTPPEMLDKKIMGHILRRRAAIMGNQIQQAFECRLLDTKEGKANGGLLSYYQLLFAEGERERGVARFRAAGSPTDADQDRPWHPDRKPSFGF